MSFDALQFNGSDAHDETLGYFTNHFEILDRKFEINSTPQMQITKFVRGSIIVHSLAANRSNPSTSEEGQELASDTLLIDEIGSNLQCRCLPL